MPAESLGGLEPLPGALQWRVPAALERGRGPLEEAAGGHGLRLRAATWGLAQVTGSSIGGGARVMATEGDAASGPGGAQGRLGTHEVPTQTPTFWSAGESCEARDTVPTLDCADHCPRSCADLWDRVQCLQGRCHPGSQATPPAQPGNAGEPAPASLSPAPRELVTWGGQTAGS